MIRIPTALLLTAVSAGYAYASSPIAYPSNAILEHCSEAFGRPSSLQQAGATFRAPCTAPRPSLLDWALPGQMVGGGFSTAILSSEAAGDRSITVSSQVGLVTGRLLTSPYLPTGTTITGVHAGTSTTVIKMTSATTMTDAQEQALAPAMTGLSNVLIFSGVLRVPVGARVSGTGIPPDTAVSDVTYSGNTTSVSLSVNVTHEVSSGARIAFTFTQVVLSLSNGWTKDVTPESGPVGVTSQDDSAAFIKSTFGLAPASGGPGGIIDVPASNYYLENYTYAQPGTVYQFAPGTSFLPGSQSISAVPSNSYVSDAGVSLGFNDNASAGGAFSLYDELSPLVKPETQSEALLVKQVNLSRTNDGGLWGPGMVGEEVQQSISPSIHSGIMWAYHATDGLVPGQLVAWAGVEAELANNSGFWGAFTATPLAGGKTGLHIDNIGAGPSLVPNSIAFQPGGDWHTALSCIVGGIHDWCAQLAEQIYVDYEPITVAGLDSTGRQLATSLDITPAPVGGSAIPLAPGAHIDSLGNIGARSVTVSSIIGATGGVASVTVVDGGHTDGPVALAVAPAGGKTALASVTDYALDAVQGSIARNTPSGMVAGDVYTVPGGICFVQPQVAWDGTEFTVKTAGVCAIPPWATRTAPVTLTGGSATVKPAVWLLWAIKDIAVTASGTGYNPGVPPYILAAPAKGYHHYTPFKLAAVMTSAASPLSLKSGKVTGLSIGPNGSVTEPVTSTPASSSAACTTGQHAWDTSYEYRCVATNKWKRTALSAW